jgi:hypothetical protein
MEVDMERVFARFAAVAMVFVLASASRLQGQTQQNGQVSNATGTSEKVAPTVISTPDTRLVIGAEDYAASASPSNVALLLDGMLSAPMRSTKRGMSKVWVNFRLGGAPVAASTITVGQLLPLTTGDLVAGLSSVQPVIQGLSLDHLVQGLRTRAGVQVPITSPINFEDDTQYTFQLNAVGGFGFSTPVNAQVAAPQIWVYDPSNVNLTSAYPQHTNSTTSKPYDYIAFVPPDRSRFFAEWSAGLRLETHHFHDATDATGTPNGKKVEAAFPGIFDITIGQNQEITAGSLKGAVLHLGGFYPLPGEAAAAFYLFGAIDTHLAKPTANDAASTALYLAAAPGTVKLTDSTVDVRAIVPGDRDEWRFGVGVDALVLFKGLKGLAPSATTPTLTNLVCTSATGSDTTCTASGKNLSNYKSIQLTNTDDASNTITGTFSPPTNGGDATAKFTAADWTKVVAGKTYSISLLDANNKAAAMKLTYRKN